MTTPIFFFFHAFIHLLIQAQHIIPSLLKDYETKLVYCPQPVSVLKVILSQKCKFIQAWVSAHHHKLNAIGGALVCIG